MQPNQLPGLLSDKQIRELCTPPTFMVSERVPGSHAANTTASPDVYLLPQVIEYPTYLLEAQLQAKKYKQDMQESTFMREGERLGILSWRPLTEEELARHFKPMIEPFYPNQEKLRERNATDLEGQRIMSWHAGGLDREAILARLKLESPGIQSVRTDPLLGIQILEKIVSYGLSSAGYDVRLGRKFKIFTNIRSALIDPLNMSDDCYVDHEGDDVIIPPHSYILGHTPEVFDVPRDVMIVCVGKSTYARAGCAVNVTPIEPGFKGQVVIEIANQTPLPMKVYADMGIAQFLFFKMGEPCETSYADRKGKYQNQTGITTARV